MKFNVFVMAVGTLILLLAVFNSFWLGRLLRPSLRRKFRVAYGVLTLLGVAAYFGIRSAGQFGGTVLLNGLFYFLAFWALLQLLLPFAWPFSKIAAFLQQWLSPPQGDNLSSSPKDAAMQPGMTRRTFLSTAAVLPPVAMAGINAVGFLDAEFRVVLRRIDLAYAGLPPELDGLKIGHITDSHIGTYISAQDVKKMATLLQQESPDLLAITGDFVDDVSLLPGSMDVMKPLLESLPLGAWFCMGNHEHMRGATPIRKVLHQYGIRILDNRNQQIPFGGMHFTIAGVDYPVGASAAARPETSRRYLESACGNIDPADFTVLLSHHPDFVPLAFERRIGLTLCGHTHGGQVGWGQRSALGFLYPYMRGVYRDEQSFGFVSSGAGHWVPFRLNCPPEVSLITLKRRA